MPSSPTVRDSSTHPDRDPAAALVALAVAACAALVMLAWKLRLDAVIQVLPGLTPMQFNTALGLLLSGSAIGALAMARPRTAVALALVAGSIGLASSLQYATGNDLGIDQLLHRSHLAQATSHPGRMSPPTGVALFLLGCVVVLLVSGRGEQRAVLASLLVSLVLALAGSALLGYALIGTPLLGGPGVTLMAVNTALLLALLAVAVRRLLRPRLSAAESPPPLAIELLVVSLLIGSLLLWRELGEEERQSAEALQRAELEWLSARLRSNFNAFDRPLRRMVERAPDTGPWPEPAWRLDARLLLRDVAGLVSLQFLDREGRVRWVEPEDGTRALIGTRPNVDPQRRALLERAADSGEVVLSPPIELLQGGLGLLLFAPVPGDDPGFLVGVLRLADRLETVIEASLRHTGVAVLYGDQVIFEGEDHRRVSSRPGALLRVPIGGDLEGWSLVAHPAGVPAISLRLADLTLAIAVGASLLVQLALFWWWAGLRRARDLRAVGEALAEANRRTAMATQVARIGIWEWRRERNELIWDAQCRELFGATEDGRAPIEVLRACLDGDAQREIARGLRRAVAGDGVVQLDLAIRRLDGTQADLHLTGRVIGERSRRQLRVLGVVMDVTERQRLERLKSAFVSTVSHELRTPLTAISGSLALIDSGRLAEVPEPLRPLLRVSRENSDRLTLLINDLLDMEQLTQGGIQLSPRELDLSAELDRALALNRSYAEALDVRFSAARGAAAMAVIADPDRLQQVLSNLLSNACKFSSPGQTVEISAGAEGAFARIEVLDRGSGVPEAFRNRLFSRFSQADASDSRRHSGTGLGLSICRELVERMGGTIGYAPRGGGGSVFWFTVPLVPGSR
ncbi:sensor histidine kinase [Pseudomarimonas salicorniae]|uniref:histidine kinase n=1 Tax=Pseudomarimonas salicorniae TaxID=2933270 RepID=A0ABT0GIX5_9GAMM|nr:ATP-binding protein [Lysobacter sp. CAU 1642]MCK7594499.1 ATP-binding protein [Lysobacter sp. CAU 1642]